MDLTFPGQREGICRRQALHTLLDKLVTNLNLHHEVALLLIRSGRDLLLPDLEQSILNGCRANF